MKKLSIVLILFILTINQTYADTYSSDPKMFVSELVNDVINKLSDKNLTKEEKSIHVEKVAIKNVDIEGSRKVKLRKPDDFLPTALSGSPKQLDTAWKKLTTKTGTPNARINKDTVLLKVSIK